MAASQARLLCLTARIHDVEYQAQAIQSAKLQLATQSDRVYEEYLEAMDASTLTVNAMDMKTGASSIIAANFNNLCSRNRVMPADGSTYAIRNNQGLLVVEDEIYEAYQEFTGAHQDDPYQFAMYMMGNQDIGSLDCEKDDFATKIESAEADVFNGLSSEKKDEKTTLGKLYNKLVEILGTDIYGADADEYYNGLDDEKKKEYDETFKKFRQQLYKSHAGEIYAKASEQGSEYNVEEEFDSSLFNYYASIYNQIRACGGCTSIDFYDGPNGDASNNTEWLQSMVQSGQFTIEIVTTDRSTGEVSLDSTSPSSDSCLSYTTTSKIDNRALAKAEEEYEHKMKQIDKKDQKFDLDLSKLETERTALTTEYESVKKVIEDNIDRTFGIFS